MPEVSVIVPNYNHAAFLVQRLESILNQTFQDFELIILDDCSTDNSREIIEQYRQHPRLAQIVYNTTNAGSPFKQWKKGMALAKGKWLWIAESDDYAEPHLLESLVALTKDHEDVGIAYCGSNWVNDKNEIGKDLSSYHESFYKNGIEEVKEKLWYVCTVQNASSAIFRKDIALKNIKGMGKFVSCGDWIFYTKILQESNLAFTAEKLNYFRYYHANTSNWAEKKGLWVTEGVYVLKQINFGKVKFTVREFKNLLIFWYNRAKTLNDTRKYNVLFIAGKAAFRYLFSF